MTKEELEKEAIKEYVKNWKKVCKSYSLPNTTPDNVIVLSWQSLDEENKEGFRDIVRRRLND